MMIGFPMLDRGETIGHTPHGSGSTVFRKMFRKTPYLLIKKTMVFAAIKISREPNL